jgi:transcriptional regulator with XRE-family HTH domain
VSDEAKVIGQHLRRLREEIGWSQADLADAAGVNKFTLQAWEQGRREPLASHLPKLARALGVSTDELLGLGTPRDRPEPTRPKRPRPRRK